VSASRIAARVQRIKPSPSSAAADRAAELRRQGKTIVNLVVGEPDFDTPAHIRQAAFDAMERGETRYTQTAGTPALTRRHRGETATRERTFIRSQTHHRDVRRQTRDLQRACHHR
jgi:Aspartate/tyrosine/aromatic aminotransferase